MKLHVLYGLINTAVWLFGETWGFQDCNSGKVNGTNKYHNGIY